MALLACTQVKSSDDWEGHMRVATLASGYLFSSYSLREIHRKANANWEWSQARVRFSQRVAEAGDPLVRYEPVHHAVIPQGGKGRLTLRVFFGEQWGRFIPKYITNRSWNLMRPPAITRMMGRRDMQAWHTLIHGGTIKLEEGAYRLSLPERLWYGSPPWLRRSAVGYVGITSATVAATTILGEMRTEERESNPEHEPATNTGGKTDDPMQRMRWNMLSGGYLNFTGSTKQINLNYSF